MPALKNKITVITGAASGIGKEATKLFAQEGAIVNVIDIKKISIPEIKKENIFRADISNYNQIKNIIKKIVKKYKKIDILVNNAGVAYPGTVADTSYKEFTSMSDTNFQGVFNLMSLALPHMRKQKKGTIINTASDLGLQPTKNGAVYSATKAAVVQLTKSSALDEKKYNIRINAICPDAVDTPLLKKFRTKKQINTIIQSMPHGILSPQIVAKKILSMSRNSYKKTGQAIYVNK